MKVPLGTFKVRGVAHTRAFARVCANAQGEKYREDGKVKDPMGSFKVIS